MNSIQRYVVAGGGAVLLALALYVPWQHTYSSGATHREKPAGYAFIFDPPPPERDYGAFGVRVDWSRVIVPMAAVLAATIAGVVLAGKWKE